MIDEDGNTHFADLWADEKARERYLLWSKETYDHFRRYQEHSHRGHIEYGKWLMASLLAVHGGAIYAISSLKASVRQDQIAGLVDAAAWNLAGICFTLLAGFAAWVNFQCAENIYNAWAKPEMLFRSDASFIKAPKRDPITATLILAAAFGFLAGFSFLASAVGIVQTLKS
ncbi:hypothetical protein N181_09845 [Sinorhizobium fredii USDA 205]|uniref:Uncharacterized protein n=1 Tax=Rhizobium fredii TaxID=380 RepID=A0A844A6N9_RHIFR|nr:hypothetical protein [Sinorhizobium fredii]KSV90959.1 hypothetical protein N181_09845 [Sinorhizobium fredii USDA 205]MQX08643.1 hypothetical protein [Sinorhizobium fredii]GEC30510.1 hypothetical protein EFR01_06810 [Sinorhizobium fredii]GLS09707.1 hypothetical protein GCM10007864_33380 [Sinorhizobium fredii]